MTIYKKILSNDDYLNTMNQIDEIKFITDGKWDWEHGLGHAKRVAEYVKKILMQLNVDERNIDLAMTAALLHDVGLIKGKKTDHAIESSKLYDIFIEKDAITKEENYIIKDTISNHSKGNNINSLVSLALVLADKLDVTYHRTEHSSIQDRMNKEIQKIREVDIIIDDKNLIVKYITINKFDFAVLYGWDKSITIPKKIANILNKEYVFMINEKRVM